MEYEQINVSEFIKEHGLPESSKLLGYAIHLPNEDEFLAHIEHSSSITKRAFTQSPQHAKIYQNHKKAIRDARSCKQEAIVCLIFDIGNQYAVVDAGLI